MKYPNKQQVDAVSIIENVTNLIIKCSYLEPETSKVIKNKLNDTIKDLKKENLEKETFLIESIIKYIDIKDKT